VAVTRAPKKGAKASKGKAKPAAKKSSAKKASAKKVKPIKKVEKVPLKQVLDAKDVAQILKVRELATQQKTVLAELEARGVTNIHRIVKKADQDLVLIARELEGIVPKQIEKLKKAGLGSPFRMLKKTELELVAPPAPKAPAAPAKGEKVSKVKIDGEEVELEEVELEDLDSLIDEKEETPTEEGASEIRVVNVAEESQNEENSFVLKDSEEDDAPAQTVLTAGATADPVKDY